MKKKFATNNREEKLEGTPQENQELGSEPDWTQYRGRLEIAVAQGGEKGG